MSHKLGLFLALAALSAAGASPVDELEAGKAHARALLVQHQYREALQIARELNHRMPDDLGVYGILIDADIALGDLKDAEKQAQWMMDLGMRRPNVPALVRVARLRMLFGDSEGALQMVTEALAHTPATEADRRATLLGFGAWLELLEGKTEDATAAAHAALRASSHNSCAAAVAERARAAPAAIKPEDCPCDLSF